ncbi:MAG: HAMP domain-containing histidine kinase [Lachnospiraceae bacterium]|nr:HAMP domain-containing histidine kinase [Lachnospiraceae bacterium]
MKKPTFKRLGLALLQHLFAAGVMIALAAIWFNSYIGVDSMSDSHIYWLNPVDTDPLFEDSTAFRQMTATVAEDIMQFVVIRSEMEVAGAFDADKEIDITQYANRKNTEKNCEVTAFYRLEDLIKWGKYGVEYSNRPMSMSEFVNYFGPAASVENFALDQDGELYFAGFNSDEFNPDLVAGEFNWDIPVDYESQEVILTEEQQAVKLVMDTYTTEQLEDMAFSYIVSNTEEQLNVSREDDGSLTVYVPMISCRYDTVDGERQLSAYAGNWPEYLALSENLAVTVETLSHNYELYQKGQALYGEGKTNFKYAVRMTSDKGMARTFTNVPDMKGLTDSKITEYFSEYRRYFVYFLEDLEFTGMTSLTEGDIYRFMKDYSYAYPENTHIWMAVDTAYEVEGDIYYDSQVVFNRIVPNINKLIATLILLFIGWIGLLVYLSFTAGIAYNEEGERVYYRSGIDHFWTELLIIAVFFWVYEATRGIGVLESVADTVYNSHSEVLGMSGTKMYEYGAYGLYGIFVSFFGTLFWYSFIRRMRTKTLWWGSFCYWVYKSIRKGVNFIFNHKNTAISTLLPYNLFRLWNLIGAFLVFTLRDTMGIRVAIVVISVVLVDGLVGVWLFRRNAEQIDIVEGIKRIRDGEVDYKLDVDSLSGGSRELADAVNNIGDGISKAVQTSMKDEQMKSDLITNVSHDIKTPLTSIISYVDLLKRLKIEEEPAKGYIDILDNKAQRLKQLTDDLVEASKISSGNIVLNMEQLNLTELLNQAVGEFSEKFEERSLSVVFEECNVPAYIYADSRRMWRVVENLYNNICKYAMDNTRVYMELEVADGKVTVSIKNISERQMNMKGEELTERFIRGDSSRTTEGSGLGLFIAKSLTQAQGGVFEIQLDGDLFKVILVFPEYKAEENSNEQ